MSKAKTDNSNFKAKIQLRKSFIPDKENINVLDCFHGEGKIWNSVKQKINKKINIVGIEKKYKKSSKKDFVLYGDCLKYLKNLDLSNYDIIDLDCYGSPTKYIGKLLKNKTLNSEAVIFYTNIYTMFGCQTKEVLESNNISMKMYHKCHDVFNKKRVVFFYNFLYNLGIKSVNEINIQNHKYYGMFKINPE